VAAFASEIALYLLDEPTSGLDPLMEVVFQDVVRELRDVWRTVAPRRPRCPLSDRFSTQDPISEVRESRDRWARAVPNRNSAGYALLVIRRSTASVASSCGYSGGGAGSAG
jgi:hypothetical protein